MATIIAARARRAGKAILVYGAIVAVTLVLCDLALVATGLFPPPYRPGHPTVGWVAATPPGELREYNCFAPTGGARVTFLRNEDGYRTSWTSADLSTRHDVLKIAETGDSHSDLCAPNERTHFGFTEQRLTENGHPAVVFSYAAGRYSPLQAYLAIEPSLERYGADVLILNLYTGNDFNDILRVDDRPYFVDAGDGYRIAEPIWYEYDDPESPPWSRLAYAVRSVSEAVGIRNLLIRLRYLNAAAAEQGEGLGTVLAYMNDLRHTIAPDVGYSGAFAAQMLNQQLFFHRFPASRDESLRRVRALLELVRSKNPDRMLVLSPIPSYQLVGEQPVSPSLLDVISRLPITYESGVQEEGFLYGELETMAGEAGWVFVDNLSNLRRYEGPESLFNTFDYHIEPVASEIIGTTQAATIQSHLP